ncbi:MAG: DUF2721 domain-containing protein [Methylococcales bacterium]|nr:DUF2721 domain-containing protein [Methylococcales bacterium]
MISQLEDVVNLVTGSLVLFSSIGIFVLTLNARYTQAIARVREIYDHLKSSDNPKKLAQELDAIVFRCHLLKWSFGLLICSAISSGLFLLSSIFSRFMENISPEILILCVVCSVLFIFSSMVFLFMDVLASLKATLIHIERWK